MADASIARIVVTVGTDHHPFDRLVDWVDRWAARHLDVEILLQRGTTAALVASPNIRSVDMLAYDDLVGAMAGADAVVAQGGPGGILDARSVGHRPIVVPRRHDLGEHVDDHQVRFAAWMAERGSIDVASDEADLAARLDAVLADPTTQRVAPDAGAGAAAVERFRAIVDPLVAVHRARRRGH